MNEYGFSGDMLEEVEKKKKEGQAVGADSTKAITSSNSPQNGQKQEKPKSAAAKKTD